MGAFEARGTLAKAVHDLTVKWHDVKMNWSDPQAQAMETEVLQPLELDVRAAISATEQLALSLAQAKRDCDD
jgi:hypothetical protein